MYLSARRRIRPRPRPIQTSHRRNSGRIFTIREIRRDVPVIFDMSESDHCDESEEPDDREIRTLVQKNCSFIEAFLNFEYRLGFSPFRIDKVGSVVTSKLHKLWAFVIMGLAMISLIINLNLVKSSINRKQERNNIGNYVQWLHYFTMVTLHVVYWKTLWSSGPKLSDYIAKCRNYKFATTFYASWVCAPVGYFVTGLRLVSLIICSCTIITGIDVVHTSVLRAHGWSFTHVLLAREYKIMYAFPRFVHSDIVSANQANTTGIEDDGGHLNNKQLLVGFLAGLTTFFEFCINSSIRDLVLITTVSLYALTKAKNLSLRENATNNILSRIQKSYEAVVARYEELVMIAKEITSFVRQILPYVVAVDVLTINSLLHTGLDGNWCYAVSVGFNLLKGFTTFYIAICVNREVESFQEWFVSRKTQEILRLPPSHVHSMIYEFSLNPVGIGTSAFQIDSGFIANFIGITSSYFFIVAEASADT